MTVTPLGIVAVGTAVPGASAAVVAGVAGINLALPDLAARIAALQGFQPQPVSFVAQLAIAQGTLASIQAAITLGLPVPDISAQIALVAAVVAELLATLAQMNAQLDILLALEAPLNAGSIAAYAYDGPIGNLGGELGAAVGGGGGHANALALVATDSASWAALSAVMKVSA